MALSGCVVREPTAPQAAAYIVESVLDFNTPINRVSVRFTTPRVHGVTGAAVTLTAPNGTVFDAVPDSVPETGAEIPGMYRFATRNELRRGLTYALRVVTPSGHEITGSTTIPFDAVIGLDTTPLPFVLRQDTVRMAWPVRTTTTRYWVHVHSKNPFDQVVTEDVEYSFFAERELMLPWDARTPFDEPLFTRDHRVTIVVAAVDENFYQYYRTRLDPFSSAPPSRLTGAIGVFGSVTPLMMRRYHVR